MGEAPQFVLYEHAVGYALLRVKEFEDIGLIIPEVEASVGDVQRFCSIVKLEAFEPFRNTEAALENCNSVSEGILHQDLLNFLEANLPKKKKKKGVTLGVSDGKLAGAISDVIDGVTCYFTGVVPEILRGVRVHFAHIAKDLPHHSLSKAQLSLGHFYSRGKVKFDVHRVDNMVIQSIALLDQLDKDINLFGMRIREWYSYHFPELYKIVPDQYQYTKCASIIMDRKKFEKKADPEVVEQLKEVLNDDEKVNEVIEAARTSMGMEISELDLVNIELFASRIRAINEYRTELHQYVSERMGACAPSLAALIGEQVGARLISHAGSLTNLAKFPASTVQILGAEKALFRALKTRSNTPKYGLLFHSSFIGRASAKNKGRISRFLANKCSMASRIDCFLDVPVSTFGEHLKQQVEDRLKYFETGDVPKKNVEVMKEAAEEAVEATVKVLKKRKKEAKKARKSAEAAVVTNGVSHDDEKPEVTPAGTPSTEKKKRKRKAEAEESIAVKEEAPVEAEQIEEPAKSPKKKKRKMEVDEQEELMIVEEEPLAEEEQTKSSKKKKKKKSDVELVEDEVVIEEEVIPEVPEITDSSKKKKKRKKELEVEEEQMVIEEEAIAEVPEVTRSPKKKKKNKKEPEVEEESLVIEEEPIAAPDSAQKSKKKKKHKNVEEE